MSEMKNDGRRRRRVAWVLPPLLLVTSAGVYVASTWSRPVEAASGGSGNAAATPQSATPPSKSLSVSATSVSGLAPGVTRPFTVTVTNNDAGDVRLTQITSTVVASSLPPSCGPSNFSVTSFSAPGSTGPILTKKGGKATVPLQLTMLETGVNQDACKARSLTLSFTATAQGK